MSSYQRKVLIIVENLPVPFDTRVWQEAKTLKENHYQVSVICPKGKGYENSYEQINGIHIFRHDMPAEGNGFIGYLREYLWALKEEIRLAKKVYKELGFDVIHGCNPPDNIFLVAKLFKRYGVKYIFDHHDICPELFYAKFKRHGILYKFQLLFERLTYKNASLAFVTNGSYRKIALERGRMKEENVFVLRSGPNLERIIIKKPNNQLKRGKKFMVGYIGVIGQQEGLDYLMEAVRYIKYDLKRDDVCFAICGGGPYLEAVSNKSHTMGIADIVTFTGRIPDEKLLNYLNTADVCVNPDEYNDMNDKSTMNKVLEYMALSKPIVQFDLTEGRNSAKNASLYAIRNDAIDLAEKIIYLLDHEDVRKEMGTFGYKRIINELGWEHTSKALINGYEYFYRNIMSSKTSKDLQKQIS